MHRMSVAETIASTTNPLAWAEICDQHPNEWVCLVEIEHQADGQIRSATVVGHYASLTAALHQVDAWEPDRVVAYAHTGGRKLRLPRIEITNEIHDIIRARW